MKKTKHVTIRIEDELYQSYVEKALKRAQKERRIVRVAEVIREALLNNK